MLAVAISLVTPYGGLLSQLVVAAPVIGGYADDGFDVATSIHFQQAPSLREFVYLDHTGRGQEVSP
ncbi:hypothetical protein, partial [Pseudomonas aeruginosa]|uniref:hypothetical protein n=1 Tax=Pseudomonas aeruginosa TaxID=287 RepID=UPI0031B6D639